MSNYNSTLQSNNIDLQAILNTINELPEAGGVELPELINEGTASDLLSGKQLIDGEGNIVTGTIPTKTSSDLTTNGATVTVPSGYYASQATKSVASATQATPSISVNSNGLITASATQTAGYVSAGTKSATKQLTTQAAKTITPSTTSQTAVSSGVYTTGTVTVGAIPSQYIVPSGTKNITTNGTHDIKSYASATVNVAGEDVASETSEYTSKLTSLENSVIALKAELQNKASGGSGGGSVEAWTGTIICNDYYTFNVYYTDKNLVSQVISVDFEEDVTIEIVKNTYISICQSGLGIGSSDRFDGDNIEIQYETAESCCALPTSNNFVIRIE